MVAPMRDFALIYASSPAMTERKMTVRTAKIRKGRMHVQSIRPDTCALFHGRERGGNLHPARLGRSIERFLCQVLQARFKIRGIHKSAEFCTCLRRCGVSNIIFSNRAGEVRFIVVLDTANP